MSKKLFGKTRIIRKEAALLMGKATCKTDSALWKCHQEAAFRGKTD